jgi:hypothetical protein
MRTLAALMLSLTLLTSALFVRAIVDAGEQRPASTADRVAGDHGRPAPLGGR